MSKRLRGGEWPGTLLAAMLAPLGSTSIAVALPEIQHELGIAGTSLELWLVVSYLVVSIVGQAPGGRVADRLGHERTLLAGLALWGVGSGLGALATGLPGLAAGRIAMAAGGALTMPAAMARLRAETPREKRGGAFGALAAGLGLAAAVGPLAGGALVGAFGWRAVFAANLPVIALSALLLAAPARGARSLVAARQTVPALSSLRLLGRRELVAPALVVALQNLVLYALLFELPQLFARSGGAGAAETGRVLGTLLAAMVVSSLAGGRLADAFGSRGVAFAGGTLALAGLLALPELGSASPAAALFGLVLFGAGIGLATAPAQAAAMGAAGEHEAGAAAGALSTLRYLGGIAGIAGSGLGGGSYPPVVYALAIAISAALALAIPGRTAPSAAPAGRWLAAPRQV